MARKKFYIGSSGPYFFDDDKGTAVRETNEDETLQEDYAKKDDLESHGTQHESGGSDEISVAGLSGELSDPQPPKNHDNNTHTTNYISDVTVTTETTTVVTSVDFANETVTTKDITYVTGISLTY